MATIGTIAIGIAATTTGLKKGLSSASGQVQGFGERLGGLGGLVKLAAGAFAGFSAVGAIKTAIGAASDLNESVSAIGSVMGAAATPVLAFADDMASRFGLVKKETIDAAAGFGAIGKGLGNLGGKELSDFSVKFTKLAADLSSNQNMSLAEASSSLLVQLSGEQSDALKRLGVVTTEETLKQYAFAHGIATAGSELDDQQKLQARAAIIGERLAFVNGDLEKTAGGVANQVRGLGGRFTNFAAEAGAALLPITNVFLGLAGTALETAAPMITSAATWISGAFIDLTNSAIPLFQSLGEMIMEIPAQIELAFGAGTIGSLGAFAGAVKTYILDYMDMVGLVWRNLPEYVAIAGIKIGEVIANIGAYVATLPANLAIIADYIATNWYQLVTDAIAAVGTAFSNLGTNIGALATSIFNFLSDPTQGFTFNWTPLLEGFQATAAALPALVGPELVSFQDQIDQKVAEIGVNEAARAQDMAEAAAVVEPTAVPTPAADAAGAMAAAAPATATKEKFNAAALELGSQEARSADLKFMAGQTGDPMKDVAKTGRETLAEQRRQTSLLDTIARKEPAAAGVPV